MAKKEISKEVLELKKDLADGKIIVGLKTVLKSLRADGLNRIYLAKNCPLEMKEDIIRYAKLMKVAIKELKIDNEELGVFCKKHFFISVLGVKK